MAATVILGWFAILLGCSEAQLQSYGNTVGKTFTLAFFPGNKQPPSTKLRNVLYFASRSKGSCMINYHDNTRRFQIVNLSPNNVTNLALPDVTQMTNTGTGVESKAIYVNCTDEIALYGFNKDKNQEGPSDSFSVLPDHALSTRYFVASASETAFVGIVPTKANTQVFININSTCVYRYKQLSYKSGDTMNISLAYGDALRIGGPLSDQCDFGGTEVLSSDPVAVFSGALSYTNDYYYSFHLFHNYFNYMVHQVPPLIAYSHNIIVPGVSKSLYNGMLVRILASQNDTQLTIFTEYTDSYSNDSYHLDAKEVLKRAYSPEQHVYIKSSKPVMVIQSVLFSFSGDSSFFMPGISQYEDDYLVRNFDLDNSYTQPYVTIVTETAATEDLRVNGLHPTGITWKKLISVPYSVGTLLLIDKINYNLHSTSPFLVRIAENYQGEGYSYIAGYQLTNSIEHVQEAVSLNCFSRGWDVSFNLSKLHIDLGNIGHIYMTNDDCVGIIQGDLLVFNQSYHECQTKTKVINGTLTYTNSLIYAPPTGEQLVRRVVWVNDIKCTMPLGGTDSVHIYPDFSTAQRTESSEIIKGSTVKITLYKDAYFNDPVDDSLIKAKIGDPVFVQVEAPGHHDIVMVVNSCDAHLEDDKMVSFPLIKNRCTVDAGTQILVSRYQLTRFKFKMFDLPSEKDGIYVTCHVVFCLPSDLSERCQQQCQRGTDPGLVG